MVHFVELETERSGFRVRVSSLSWLDFRLMAGSIDRLTGTVRWFDVRRGFGFITPEDGGEDLFVHQSSIKAVGYRSLAVGETVEFVVSVGDGGRRRAVSVTGPGGAYIKGNKYFGGSCYRCGEVGHMVKDCKSIGICARLGPCYSCGEMGHLARECPATRIEPSSPRPNLFKPSKLSSMSNFSLPMAMLSDSVKEDMRTTSDGFWESMDSDEEEEDVLSDEDKEFPRGLEERNWAELPRDVLSVIFKKIAAVEIISSVQFVCRPWRQLSHEPELWRRIDMRTQDDYLEKMLDLESMARVAVDRSEGCVEEFYAENFGSDEFMGYIAERATKLRCLHLISVFHMSDMALVQAVRRFPLLEEFEISFCSFADEVVELVGQACPQLKSFRLNAQPYESQYDPDSDLDENVDTVPLAIAKHMQQLRRLQLLGNSLTNIGLLAILGNCPNLQCLDIRRCVNVLLDETLKKKCARIKDLRLPNDSTADCEFDALIAGPETFDDDFESTLFGTEYDFQYDDYGYYDYGGFSSMIYDDMIYDDLFLDY